MGLLFIRLTTRLSSSECVSNVRQKGRGGTIQDGMGLDVFLTAVESSLLSGGWSGIVFK